jgi:hypothetical protein
VTERPSASFMPSSSQKDPVGPGAFSVSGRNLEDALVVRSYLGASAEAISSADACNRQYWRSLRLMYRHQRICPACSGSLWHGARVGRRLSRGTRHPVSVDLLVGHASVRARAMVCRPADPSSSSQAQHPVTPATLDGLASPLLSQFASTSLPGTQPLVVRRLANDGEFSS